MSMVILTELVVSQKSLSDETVGMVDEGKVIWIEEAARL